MCVWGVTTSLPMGDFHDVCVCVCECGDVSVCASDHMCVCCACVSARMTKSASVEKTNPHVAHERLCVGSTNITYECVIG